MGGTGIGLLLAVKHFCVSAVPASVLQRLDHRKQQDQALQKPGKQHLMRSGIPG